MDLYFNPYSILPLVASIVSLSLGFYVFNHDCKRDIYQIFLFWCICLFFWLFFYTICYSTQNPQLAIYLVRLACTSVTFVSISFYHFVVVYLGLNKEKRLLPVFYAINLLIGMAMILRTDFMPSVQKHFYGYYGVAGKWYPIPTAFFLIFTIRSFYLLNKAIKSGALSPSKSMQAKYILFAFGLAYLASIDFLPKYNIEIYPLGAIFVIMWATLMTHAFLKHQLMDINIVFRKSLVYSILVASITIMYLSIIIFMEKIFRDVFGYQSLFTSIFSAAIIATFFIPLKNKIQHYVDKLFFKGTTEEIAQENEYLRKEVAQAEKSKAIATLASGMAHEIRNPLTVIKTFYEYFPDKKDDQKFLEKFKSTTGPEIERIEHLIADLLQFAKPSPASFQQVHMSQLLAETLNLIEYQLKTYHIDLQTTNDIPNTLTISADPNKLKQAFLNIILNAIDAMPEGGKLAITLKAISSTLTISISDTGCGISSEDLKHIFEPFYTKKEKGTGLGLAIVQGIIEEHGGKIRIKSEINKGTEFIIELPLESPKNA